ncbi:hypothetical protein OG883_17160 [Streptomyces sp. NBC_01142]|nr:hypothetical protein [Streptomyces sp. NBC_01142]MCX4821588.1 hypothetical protein [Streptomyces sp. NBC_01142]
MPEGATNPGGPHDRHHSPQDATTPDAELTAEQWHQDLYDDYAAKAYGEQ